MNRDLDGIHLRIKRGEMDRNLDEIYLRIKRGEKYEPVCLSDMTREELEANLREDSAWLKGAVIHLALLLREIGDLCDLVRE